MEASTPALCPWLRMQLGVNQLIRLRSTTHSPYGFIALKPRVSRPATVALVCQECRSANRRQSQRFCFCSLWRRNRCLWRLHHPSCSKEACTLTNLYTQCTLITACSLDGYSSCHCCIIFLDHSLLFVPWQSCTHTSFSHRKCHHGCWWWTWQASVRSSPRLCEPARHNRVPVLAEEPQCRSIILR